MIRWAHVYEPSHALHKWALWASEQISVKTNRRYIIQVYPSSSLGKEAHINQSLSIGTIDIIYTGTSFAAQVHRPLGISEMPYIFENYSHWQRYVESDLFTELADDYKRLSGGNRIVSSTYYGERHLTANRAVLTPSQIDGLKIRVPGAAIYHLFPQALGAKPSPISFSEVYLAIQQGVVDAQENPLPTIKAKKFYEVQSHINLTGHILGSIMTVVSNKTLDQLKKEDYQIFLETLRQASAFASKEIRQKEIELVSWFSQQGIKVNNVDRASFRHQVMTHYTQSTFPFNRDVYDRIQSL
ncbi:MAG: sialic acid TRAP transporter substrate-binding protein SiaP [Aliiglaciecola sp.]